MREATTVIGKEAAVPSEPDQGDIAHGRGWTMSAFVFVFRCDDRVVLCLS